nr:uncharacterized protein LOC129264066 [Lytechinus pictus]
MEDMTELPNENPMLESGENEGNPIRYPPRQFAATPDPENPHRVLRMDDHSGVDGEELRIARDRNNVPEITIESMTSTTEESNDDNNAHDGGDEEEEQQSVVRDKKESEEKENTENESQRLDFGKPVERVASPMKPRPSSPIPGRRPQIPLMALVVGAAVEKNRLDDTLGSDEAIYQQSASKYNSLLNPRDNHVSKKSLVAEIMQTDPRGNKLERASLGRYQPMGSDDVSLLRPCEMQSYKSRSSSDMQHSVSQSEKVTTTESAGKESIEVSKETDTDKGMSFLKKIIGARGSDSGPVASADKKPVTSDNADVDESGGLASTAGVLTSMIRWKTKKRLHTGTRETREKYPGYLDLFTRLSRELNTSVPFPIVLQTRREALPIIQNIAKAYKSTLGLHHQMTRQACAKVEKLRSELQDSDVFL